MQRLRAVPHGTLNQEAFRHFGQRARTLLQLRLATPLAFILLCPGLICPAGNQDLPLARSRLRVTAGEELSTFWNVRAAELRETVTAGWGYLEVENVSNSTLDGATFYGEYFDDAGRFCFSLVFSQAKNVGGKGPVAPGELRELYSPAAGLAPASEPKEVRLYLVRQGMPGQENSLRKWDMAIRAPVTGGGSVSASAADLQLGSEVALAQAPVLDLVFAKVTVDRRGSLDRVDVLDAVSTQVELWFLSFVRQLTFYPATDGGVPRSGQALVMVRAVLSREALLDSPFPLRESPWVKSYMERWTESAVPPVTDILFERPPTKVKLGGSMEWTELPAGPPGRFQLMLLGSDWGSPAFDWVIDPSMTHHLRRELAPADSR